MCSQLAAFVDLDGAPMIPDEVKPLDPDPSAKNEEAQPEDPDTARGEAFKRMFPDVPRKPTKRPKKPSD